MTVTESTSPNLELVYSEEPIHFVIMGVSGCGKSTIGRAFADHRELMFVDGDDFHPRANIAKMSAGIPLTDRDRYPWLGRIVDFLNDATDNDRSVVVACSALKRKYRDQLRQANGRVVFIHLQLSKETVRQRMSSRMGHFMPVTLLSSQLATLEALAPDEEGCVVFNDGEPQEVVDVIERHLSRKLHLQRRNG